MNWALEPFRTWATDDIASVSQHWQKWGPLNRRRWHGFFRRYREDLLGFLLAWGVVGLLLIAAWGLMQIGR